VTPEQQALLERHRERAERLGEPLLAQPPEALVSAAIVAFAGTVPPGVSSGPDWLKNRKLVTDLVRRKLPWTLEDVELVFALAFEAPRVPRLDWTFFEALGPAVSAAERYARDHDPEPLRPLLDEALQTVAGVDYRGWGTDAARLRARLRKLLERVGGPSLDLSLVQPDEWGTSVRQRLEGLERAGPLLSHLSRATSARPSATWVKQARPLLEGTDVIQLLLGEAAEGDVRLLREFEFEGQRFAEYHWLTDNNANLVRGALWAVPMVRPDWAQGLLDRLVERGLLHSTKVANACVYALGQLATPQAIAALSTLHTSVKDRGFQKQVQAALDAAAGSVGVSSTQLLEKAVPTHGLDAEGRREISVGSWTARLRVEPATVITQWVGADGEAQRTTPAAAKEAPELREVRAAAKELRKALAAERSRVESLLADDLAWSLDEWRSAYAEHPLVGVLAGGLFWRFDGDVALGGEAPTQAKEVRLWHPALSSPEEVRRLRQSLVDGELVQPFKQAYREIYLLAPAERETGVYSNRFASHVLRYPQTYALLKERGWGGGALGPWDGGYETTVFREFRDHGLRAEWWLENADVGEWTGGALANLATTDQVRFAPLKGRGRDPIPLEDVPPLVFSEAMRDIDLFVGVSSIGADPAWSDRGIDRFDTYWNVFSFGELDEAARVRRDVLAELIPKLRISDRLELGDRFLRVRGDLGTYKIHLRSGNILMEPNDQYLCIVPALGAERPIKRLYLPFEDDGRLNVILSKAFLLAGDSKIDDPTIRAQLHR
jgi:hypothetical protein